MVTYGQIIMILSGVLTIGAVITMFSKIVKWFDRLEDEIRSVKDESVILVHGISACLDGIHQLGANHSVYDAKQKLDEYINIAAHR